MTIGLSRNRVAEEWRLTAPLTAAIYTASKTKSFALIHVSNGKFRILDYYRGAFSSVYSKRAHPPMQYERYSMITFSQGLLIALCAASSAFAWFEHRKAAMLKRRIEQQGSLVPDESPTEGSLSRLRHDVKNPITSILCFCSLLRHNSTELTAKQSDYVSQIQSSANAILTLVNQLQAPSHAVETVEAEPATARRGADS